MMTTTRSLTPSTVQLNITPGALNPASFPHLPGAQLLTTTTTATTPVCPPVLNQSFPSSSAPGQCRNKRLW